jgi:hypothetical protein
MPKCSSCNCEMPGFQTLCRKCYEREYAQIAQPKKSKSLRQRVTLGNVLFSLLVFAFSFVAFRTAEFHLHSYPMPTKTSAISALLFASIAFYVESGR